MATYLSLYFSEKSVRPLIPWEAGFLNVSRYRNVYFHKQTKNTWARDDPAVYVLVSCCLFFSALAWSLAQYGLNNPLGHTLNTAVIFIVRDYGVFGAVIATLLWLFSNKLLLSPPTHASPQDASVEWRYAFDVHTNAFFPSFLTLHIAQLFLFPLVTKSNWVCLFLGNTLYLAGFAQYVYGAYLGMSTLPYLIRTELLLFPLLPLFATYIVTLLGFNIARHVLKLYF